jgi:hypothetical protein
MTAETTRVSVATNGTQADGESFLPSISADGGHVAFRSTASNLVAGDTNSVGDVFVRNRVTGATTRISVASDETQANGESVQPSISADGRYVAFYSLASNLVAGDTNGVSDVFVHDQMTDALTRISVATNGTQGDGESYSPSISEDGRYVAFFSSASNLVANDTNAVPDVFVHDTATGATTRVSAASDGTQGNNGSGNVSAISADGHSVAFSSAASNLVLGDTNGVEDVFVAQDASLSPPGPFEKTLPADGATGAPISLTLTWAASAGATSYDLCLDVTPNTTCDGAWVSVGTMTSWPLVGLTPGAIYSWHVRAMNADGTTYSDGSAITFHTFIVAALGLPDAFSKTSPTNGATGQPTTLLLRWDASNGATGYELCLDVMHNATCDEVWIPVGNVTSWAISGLTPGVIYSWHVRAMNGGGTTDANSGTWWSFVPGGVASPSGDFNGDGRQDLIFQNPDGQVYAWFLNGLSFGSGAWLAQDLVGPDWRIVATSDLTGDQKADLLWQHQTTGAVMMQAFEGTTRIGSQAIPIAANTPWRIRATGDFNGDGRADIVWQNATSGQVYIWHMKVSSGGIAEFDSGTYVTHPDLSSPVTLNPMARTEWQIAGAGDFDGDGKQDLAWRNLSTGALTTWLLDGAVLTGSISYAPVNLAWQLRAVGDYYGDAAPDLVWQNTTTGELYLWVRDAGALLPDTSLGFTNLAWAVVGAK